MRQIAFLCLLLCLGACTRAPESEAPSAGASGASPVLRFTAIPDQDARRLQERFGAFAEWLSSATGVPVTYVPVTSYAAAVTAFVNGDVELAWFGGLSGLQAAERRPGARVLAQGVEDARFTSVFIANRLALPHDVNPGEQLPTHIRGRTFTFGDRVSTSGRLIPEHHLRAQFGAPPEKIFARVGFSGDHTSTLKLVASGAYDVGALSGEVWVRERAAGRLDVSQVVELWRSPPFSDYHWRCHGDLDARFGEGFTARLTEALLTLSDPALLAHFQRSGFIAAAASDYAVVREMGRALGLLRAAAD